MRFTVEPLFPPGRLAAADQPVLPVADGLALRPWTVDDAPAVLEAFSDPLIRHWNRRRIETLDDAREWIDAWQQAWAAESDVCWAMVRTTTDEVVGRLALRDIDPIDRQAEVGYWVMPGSRGQGLAPLGLEAMRRWAMDDVGLHRLWIAHAVANEPSCRVAEKAGFALEGTMRDFELLDDGWHDLHLHARVASG